MPDVFGVGVDVREEFPVFGVFELVLDRVEGSDSVGAFVQENKLVVVSVFQGEFEALEFMGVLGVDDRVLMLRVEQIVNERVEESRDATVILQVGHEVGVEFFFSTEEFDHSSKPLCLAPVRSACSGSIVFRPLLNPIGIRKVGSLNTQRWYWFAVSTSLDSAG